MTTAARHVPIEGVVVVNPIETMAAGAATTGAGGVTRSGGAGTAGTIGISGEFKAEACRGQGC